MIGILLAVVWIPKPILSNPEPKPVVMGIWNTISSSNNAEIWQCYTWKENPILIEVKGSAEIALLTPDPAHELIVSNGEYKVISQRDGTLSLRILTTDRASFRCRYTLPNRAMVSFASLYSRLAIRWQKRLYHQNRLDSLHPTPNEMNPSFPHAGEQLTGAPYVWGGKQSLQEIVRKLKAYPSDQSWLSIRLQFPEGAGVNLDEGESAWDTPKGSEYPPQWCGLDCSGLVEQCARYAGLRYDWPHAPRIATGTYQGIDHYENLQPGDVVMILKRGILVHFGIVSKKGYSVRTTKIIHTVWFTNYRLHHNSVLKTIETSLAELSNLYEYQFIRLIPW